MELTRKELKEYTNLIEKSLNNQLKLSSIDEARYEALRIKRFGVI